MDMNPREINLEIYLRRQCDKRGWEVIKVGHGGWPDDVVITRWGVHGWIELKRRTGVVSELQHLRVLELDKRRVKAVIARSERDIDRFLEELEILDTIKGARFAGCDV